MVPTTVEWEIVAEMPLERGGDTEEGSFLRIATADRGDQIGFVAEVERKG